MTEASLCKKSYFGAYLRYRLGRMKIFLIVGAILNFMVMPLQGLLMLVRVNRLAGSGGTMHFTAMAYITVFGVFAAIAGLVFTMICAVSSYSFFCKKETVDTLGVLAVTYRQRFWGDFLGGFIPSVGMFIPSALIGIILIVITQNKLDPIIVEQSHLNIMPYFMGFMLALFFANLFIYLLTTLAAMCCGRSSSMIVFTVISFAAVPIFAISLSKFLTLEAVGVSDDIVKKMQQLCMPVGLFFSPFLKSMGLMIDEHNQKLLLELSEMKFAVLSPASIVVLSVAAAAILALAYFAGRNRKQENVGRMFVRTGYFHVISIIMSLGGFLIVADIFRNSNRGLIIPIGIGVSLVIAVIFEVIRKPKARQLPKAAARWAVTAACGVGLMFLLSKTGAFGMINIPKDMQSLRIYFYENTFPRTVELTSPEEIGEFLDAHNKTALKNNEFLSESDGGDYFSIVCVTADGDEVTRRYCTNQYGYERGHVATDELARNVMGLSCYPQKLAEMLNEKTESIEASLPDVPHMILIPTEHMDEFTETLRQDILDHYDVNGDQTGIVKVKREGYQFFLFYQIQSSYENTVRLIREYNGDAETDLDAEVMGITCYLYEKLSETHLTQIIGMNLSIRERDLEKPKVKELMGLMKTDDSESDLSGLVNIYIFSNNGVKYHIPEADRSRAAKLIAQIAAESVQ